jgi:hypothetical protein
MCVSTLFLHRVVTDGRSLLFLRTCHIIICRFMLQNKNKNKNSTFINGFKFIFSFQNENLFLSFIE